MDILAMSRRVPLLGFFGSSASDDDFADRLNYKYTVAILVVFAFVVTNKHFGHNQINCWVPALFSKNFEEYTNLVCWVTNTYYIPFDKQIPNTEPEKRHTELKYYQWVAYILLFLSLLFYLPRIIWRTLSLRSGVDIKDIIEASHDFKSVSKLEKNRRMMEYMIGTIDQYVDDPRRQQTNRTMNFIRRSIALTCFMFGKFLGNYLVVLYLFVKMLYIINCVGQLFLISILLGRNYYIYGASIFKDIIQGKGYADSEYFPRVTMCKFQVRELGLKNFSHEYNVQCVLPINLFNQQIFTFLWFWYLILIVINVCALFIWIYRFIPTNQYHYAIRRIKLLRIRLIENSKITKEASNINIFKRDSNNKTMTSNEMENQAKNYSMFKILNDKDNQYLYDEDKEEREKREANQYYRYEEALQSNAQFPNLPRKYSEKGFYNEDPMKCNDNPNNFANFKYDFSQSFNMSTINEYDSYMTASSFTVKNYKEFVYEYLEADGMFMLRMVGSNSGDYVCTQVLHNLWKLFLCKKFILREMKNGKNLKDTNTNKNDKIFIFDLNYESGFDINHQTENEEEKENPIEFDRKQNKNYKMTSNTNSKKKKFFSKIFSENRSNNINITNFKTSSFNKPIRNLTNLTSRNDNLNDNDVKRFQSIRRIPLSKKSKTNQPL